MAMAPQDESEQAGGLCQKSGQVIEKEQ